MKSSSSPNYQSAQEIGINGFGRIVRPRLVLRASDDKGVVNDPFTKFVNMAYLFDFDFTRGHLNATIEAKDVNMLVNRNKIAVFNGRYSSTIP